MAIVPALFTQTILELKKLRRFLKIEFWKIEKTGKYIKRYIMI